MGELFVVGIGMVLTNDDVLAAYEESAKALILGFQRHPYGYLYESDIQAALFSLVRNRLPQPIVVKGSGNPQDSYEISVVNTEYWKRIDLVCLDVEKAPHHTPRVHMGMDVHIYDLPILVGCEIKYRKLGDKFGIEACFADVDKLERLNLIYPKILGFIQNEDDVDSFFVACSAEWEQVEIDINQPLETINIVSPSKIWVVRRA